MSTHLHNDVNWNYQVSCIYEKFVIQVPLDDASESIEESKILYRHASYSQVMAQASNTKPKRQDGQDAASIPDKANY